MLAAAAQQKSRTSERSQRRASSMIGTVQAIATHCGDTTMTAGQSPLKAIRHQEVMTQKRLGFSDVKQGSA